jgi:hypothetical protein
MSGTYCLYSFSNVKKSVIIYNTCAQREYSYGTITLIVDVFDVEIDKIGNFQLVIGPV